MVSWLFNFRITDNQERFVREKKLYFQFIIVLFIIGLNTSLVPMYISEISPLTLRGGLGTINQV